MLFSSSNIVKKYDKKCFRSSTQISALAIFGTVTGNRFGHKSVLVASLRGKVKKSDGLKS